MPMNTTDLVPYSVEDVIHGFETKPRHMILYVLYSANHDPWGFVKSQLDILFEKIRGDGTEQEVTDMLRRPSTYVHPPSVLHQEYGLISNVGSSSTALNQVYMAEIMKEIGTTPSKKIEANVELARSWRLSEG